MTTYFYSIGTWKLLVDMALMSSLLVLCFRFLKAPTSFKVSRKLHELEGTLKALIKEAESSGRGLNDQLVSRHSELKKLLYELDSVEQRIQHSISTAQSLQQKGLQQREAIPIRKEEEVPSSRRRIEVAEQAPDPVIEYIYEPVETPPAPTFQEALALKPQVHQQAGEPAFQHDQPLQQPVSQLRVQEEAPLQQRIRPRQQAVRRNQQRPEVMQEAPPVQQDASPLRNQPSPPQRQRQQAVQTPLQGEQRPLSRRLIPEQISSTQDRSLQQHTVQTVAPVQTRPAPQPVPQKNYESEVANVYSAAEQLLKAGMDLEAVSRETKLPMEQIRLLSQLVGQSDLSKVQPNAV